MSTKPIADVARELGLKDDEHTPFGGFAVKVKPEVRARLDPKRAKLALVTAINPTPFGEGKTVNTIGLGDALNRRGHRTAITIREPSLGPTFGVKGGGAGGGKAQAFPADELNLHFTGDFHAVTYAHNLLAALAEARIHHQQEPQFAPHGLMWSRVLDLPDRVLRNVVSGLGGRPHGVPHQTGFAITAASEVMATVAAALDIDDLRERLAGLVVGITSDDKPIVARDLEAQGAMTLLLKHAMAPNLIQSLEGTPMFAHMGPFGNLATAHNSVLSDSMALGLADWVVTEAGFGADLGFEKFCHIVAPNLGRSPDVAIVVATIRGLKAHSGKYVLKPGRPLPEGLLKPDREALLTGAENLRAQLRTVTKLGIPAVVAINRFPDDTDDEVKILQDLALEFGARKVAVAEAYTKGGEGNDAVAQAAEAVSEEESSITPVYTPDTPLADKITAIATQIYGAGSVKFAFRIKDQLKRFEEWGYGDLPICMAKTPYSVSHDKKLLGAPQGFEFPITKVEVAAGAGFIRAYSGDIMVMPGFGTRPSALAMDVGEDGRPVGMDW